MLSCLENLVGVRGSGTTAIRYVNELTGINVPDFDKAINTEKQSASAALLDLISLAADELVQDINLRLQDKYQIKTFVEDGAVGYYYDNKVLKDAQSGYLTGYEIRIDSVPYLAFYLSSIRLFVNTTGNVEVKIYDLTQGKLLDTITVAAIAGEIVDVQVDKTYYTHKQRLRLFVGYESTFQSYHTAYASPYNGGAERCDTCVTGNFTDSYINFRAAKIGAASAKTAENISGNSVSGAAGLSLNYSLQCSFAEHLCNVRNLLALPLMYKAGYLVMRELKHSKRLTGVVTAYGASHDELMNHYAAEYDSKMNNLITNARIPESICFGCKPVTKTRTALP